jgi:hypothetical protein
MINAKLNLVILLLNEETFKYNIVSLSDSLIELPSLSVEPFQDIDDSIRLLFKNHLSVSNEETLSFDYRLIDINIQDVLNIYYFSIISHDIQTINSYKLPIKKYEFNLPNLAKILQRLH